jgi:hypothetical protein
MIIRQILVLIFLDKTWSRAEVGKKESKSRIVYRTYYLWSDYRYGFGPARDKCVPTVPPKTVRLNEITYLPLDRNCGSTGTGVLYYIV